MKDITEAGVVECTFDHTGKLWVNVDGKCVLRVNKCKEIHFETTNSILTYNDFKR